MIKHIIVTKEQQDKMAEEYNKKIEKKETIEEITIKIVALKFLSLGWLWLIAKANNYFYQGE